MSSRRLQWSGLIAFLCVVAPAAADQPALVVAGLGDCEKITKDGAVPPSPRFWDPVAKRLSLEGGRNEMVAAQWILTSRGGDLERVDVEIADLKGPGTIAADPNIALYLQAYHFVEHGKWGGFSQVLPDHMWYPDAPHSFPRSLQPRPAPRRSTLPDPYRALREPGRVGRHLHPTHGPARQISGAHRRQVPRPGTLSGLAGPQCPSLHSAG